MTQISAPDYPQSSSKSRQIKTKKVCPRDTSKYWSVFYVQQDGCSQAGPQHPTIREWHVATETHIPKGMKII
jgi:hypothetical protein